MAPDSKPMTQAEQAALSPFEALAELKAGNARFVSGNMIKRDWAVQRAATAPGQFPASVILSCVDSRTSSEIVFDQGMGDIFNARVAGNVVDGDLLGSMEFTAKLAGVKLIAVVGHTSCGAVKGACSGAELGNLTGLLNKIKPSVEEARKETPNGTDKDIEFVNTVAELHVKNVIRKIRENSPVLAELLDNGDVMLVGAMQDLETGEVRFLDQ